MRTVLSTKKLAAHQKQLLLNTGIGLVEYEAIKTEFLDFEVTGKLNNCIITSKTAVKAIIKKGIEACNYFCVGEKTSELLRENNFNIAETANYGKDLAKIIVEKYLEEDFTFFCGDQRREDLPSILREHRVKLTEVTAYKTSLNPKKFPQEFEGVLFFSPTGVKSFTAENKMRSSAAFCIGNTTASEAKKHTDNIIIATNPSIENVIVQVVKKFKE